LAWVGCVVARAQRTNYRVRYTKFEKSWIASTLDHR
jgi:hypothetical protein